MGVVCSLMRLGSVTPQQLKEQYSRSGTMKVGLSFFSAATAWSLASSGLESREPDGGYLAVTLQAVDAAAALLAGIGLLMSSCEQPEAGLGPAKCAALLMTARVLLLGSSMALVWSAPTKYDTSTLVYLMFVVQAVLVLTYAVFGWRALCTLRRFVEGESSDHATAAAAFADVGRESVAKPALSNQADLPSML
eukprot:SAG22_NODE_4193_length_1352_cov_1.233839_2_plen_193_part_00